MLICTMATVATTCPQKYFLFLFWFWHWYFQPIHFPSAHPVTVSVCYKLGYIVLKFSPVLGWIVKYLTDTLNKLRISQQISKISVFFGLAFGTVWLFTTAEWILNLSATQFLSKRVFTQITLVVYRLLLDDLLQCMPLNL